MLANEIGGERRQPLTIALARLNGHVAAHDVTGLSHRQNEFHRSRHIIEPPDHWHRCLL
jgi:hypothetical protein